MKKVDLGIIGGGLAGLSLSILMARQGYKVVLFEKNAYPFHRVCGEYISLESYSFLENLGLPLADWQLPIIKNLTVSTPSGTALSQALPLGGFGISRFRLDDHLAQLARQAGVLVLENATVKQVDYQENKFLIRANEDLYETTLCVGSFGKRSLLDLQWERPFVRNKTTRLNNYIGVKYHIETDFPKDAIALHNFSDGYCGISAIEDNKYCLCYLTTAKNLKQSGSIATMERTILSENPHLKAIFERSKFLFPEPITISQISFERKSLVENHVLMLGDAAGMITPLCGNGMSMALHGAKMLSNLLSIFLENDINRNQLEQSYSQTWQALFAKRLWVGRAIQAQFGSKLQTELLVRALKPFPSLLKKLISATHGETF